jgi:hypothetical protein
VATAGGEPKTDPCAPVDGKPAAPLARPYDGVARSARCQNEVYAIMDGVTRALGQRCEYCHVTGDFSRATHRKEVANWMAQKFVPSLEKQGGGDVWCSDCHAASGKGRAKILGEPRKKSWAIEWMTTHLAEKFATATGDPLRCKLCHVGNLGSKEWEGKVILTDHVPPVTSHPPNAGAPSVTDGDAGVPDAAPADGAPLDGG